MRAIRITILLSALILIAGSIIYFYRIKPDQINNIIVICIDTLRYDHLGYTGYERCTTPNIDKLAEEGIIFNKAYAQSSWTVPAVMSILTSLYPWQHQAEVPGRLKCLDENLPTVINRSIPSIGCLMKENSWQTGMFSANPFLVYQVEHGFSINHIKRMPANDLTDKAIEWIADIKDKRFFCYIQYIDLHHPVNPPPGFFNYFPADAEGKRGEEHQGWQFQKGEKLDTSQFSDFRAHRIAVYDGALLYVDQEIARLIRFLEHNDLLEDTLIIITSDHGEEFWEHARAEKDMGNDPRGIYGVAHGHSMFEEQLHIPLVFYWTRLCGACPETINNHVDHIDISPTILAAVGLEPYPGFQGRNLWPYLKNEKSLSELPGKPIISSSPAYGPGTVSIIDKNLKYIRRNDGKTMLFDIQQDREERNNIIGENKQAAENLEKKARRYQSIDPGNAESSIQEYDESIKSELRALGYIN